ncbi:MAG: endolytic transglycosylase MltG [Lachnospiraceae bacterium]|nr:endolytic transglycosylase MltG [Lachnospiraceae bacterium]
MDLRTYLKGLGLGIFITSLILSLSSGNNKQMTDDEIRQRASELGMVSENTVLLTQAQALADNAKEKAEMRLSENEAAGKVASIDAASIDAASASSISGNAASGNAASGNAASIDATSVSAASVMTKPGETKSDGTTSKTAETGDATSKKPTENSNNTSSADKKTASNDNTKNSQASDKENIAAGGKSGSDVVINISSGDSSISVANKLLKAGLINDAKQFDTYLVLSGYDRKLVVGSHTIPSGASAEDMAEILTTKQ